MTLLRNAAFLAAIALAATACNGPKSYTVTGEVSSSLEGATAYLFDYGNNSRVDSATVTGGRFTFSGTITGDSIRRIDLGGGYANLILEGGEIVVDMQQHRATGTPLNEALNDFSQRYAALQEEFGSRFQTLWADSTRSVAEREAQAAEMMADYRARFSTLARPFVEAHDDALGAYVCWDWLMSLETESDLFDEAYAAAGAYVRGYGVIERLHADNEQRKKSREGMPFIDFRSERGAADGTPVSLSDYVGRGKYVLVDFWASWCGPCREEMPAVRRVWERYRGERFEVVGVAVWDDRDRSVQAVADLQLPWPQILDAGMEPMRLYGFNGIPYLILFAPDGTILVRGLRGERIEREVARALEGGE